MTITLELEATAWIFEPGHRIRLDLAGADWPNSWPPPEPVTLTVDTGSIRLALPTLHGAADRERRSRCPTFTPGARPSPTSTTPRDDPPTVWRIEHDVLGRDDPGRHRPRLALRRVSTARGSRSTTPARSRSRPSIPGDASAHATARYVIAWPEATVSSEAHLEVRSDRDAFEVTVELDVHEGDELFRSRRWYRHIPRRLQ